MKMEYANTLAIEELSKDLLFEAIVRSFGGLDQDKLRDLLTHAMQRADDQMSVQEIHNALDEWNGNAALTWNMNTLYFMCDCLVVHTRRLCLTTDCFCPRKKLFEIENCGF